jgi:hypothetical protein
MRISVVFPAPFGPITPTIAGVTGIDIGEHSSGNCPWENAYEAIGSLAASGAPSPDPQPDTVTIELPVREARVLVSEWSDQSIDDMAAAHVVLFAAVRAALGENQP